MICPSCEGGEMTTWARRLPWHDNEVFATYVCTWCGYEETR